MAFLDADLPSEDELDDDFDPAADTGAEPEDRAQFREVRGTKRTRSAAGGGPQPESQEEELRASGGKRQRQAAEEAFAALSGKAPGVSAAPSPAQAEPLAGRRGTSLAGLCRPIAALNTATAHDESWKVRLGLQAQPPAAAGAGGAASTPPRSTGARGLSAAQVLASLGLPAAPGAAGRITSTPKPQASQGPNGPQGEAMPAEGGGKSAPQPPGEAAAQPPPAPAPAGALSVAAAALAAAKAAASVRTAADRNRVTVAETRRFAGQNIQVERVVSEGEREAERQRRNRAGLDAVMASLQSVKKVNVLDKSRQDWSTFKRGNEEVDAELDVYKKSGGQYLEKVDFLKRAELSEYERERDARLRGDVRSRGRL